MFAPPVITTMPQLPDGLIQIEYQTQLAAIGGVPPYSWKVISGILPPRLMLDSQTGAIYGTPDKPGVFGWTAFVTDSVGASSAKSFKIRIDSPPMGEPRPGKEPNRLLFSFVAHSSPRTRRLHVTNEGGGSFDFDVTATTESGGPWLTVKPSEGSATAAEAQRLEVRADPTDLAAGTYFGEIRADLPDAGVAGGALTVPVTMAISDREQLLRLSQRGLTYSAIEGVADSPPQSFRVSNRGFGVMAWNTQVRTSDGGDWLTAEPESGSSDASEASPVLVRVDPTGLAAGSYYGVVQVSAPNAANSPRIVTVVLNLQPALGGTPLVVKPVGLIIVARAGESAPKRRQVQLTNVSLVEIPFTAGLSTLTGDGPPSRSRSRPTPARARSRPAPARGWLSGTEGEGVVQPGEAVVLDVEADPSDLDPGIYRGLLVLTLADGTSRALDVALAIVVDQAARSLVSARGDGTAKLAVTGPSGASCERTELAAVLRLLGGTLTVPASWPTSVEVVVVDNCGAAMDQGSVVLDFTDISSPSLALGHAAEGVWTGTWNTPDVSDTSMAGVTVTASDQGGISGSLSQSVTVEPNAETVPRLNEGGVAHSANFVQDPLAPGTIIALFGENLSSEPIGGGVVANTLPLPTELAGTEITLGGVLLPLLFSREDQVNAILPFELENRVNESLSFLVRRTDLGSVALSAPLFINDARPGIYTQDASGGGPGSIQDVGFQLITAENPVSAGDVIVIYCAGLGDVTPDVTTGEASTLDPLVTTTDAPTVTVGGLPAAVAFSGLTPGLASLYQINATVPAGVETGEVEVVVSILGHASTVVTLFVE